MNERRTQPQKGFTLVESAVTILIMGLLLAMGVPALQSMNQTMKLQGSAQNLAAQMRLTRERAIATGVNQQMCFTTNYPSGTTIDYHLHNGAPGPGWSLPTGISYYGGSTSLHPLTFRADGRVDKSGYVVLTNTRGARDTVSVQLSGMVLSR